MQPQQDACLLHTATMPQPQPTAIGEASCMHLLGTQSLYSFPAPRSKLLLSHLSYTSPCVLLTKLAVMMFF
jgi:hypothetical protein